MEKKGSDEIEDALKRMTSDIASGFQCLVCPMVFRQLFSLVQHQQRHFAEDKLMEKYEAEGREDIPSKVPITELEEAAQNSAVAYLSELSEAPTEIRPHRCPHCSKTYTFAYYLENHIKKCSTKKENKIGSFCEQCGLDCGSKAMLERHQTESHGYVPTKDGSVPCEYCERVFDDVAHMDFHVATDHVGETPFKCSLCDASFAIKVQLDEHNLKLHNLGFICEHCNKIFAKKKSLEMHVQQAHQISYGTDRNVVCAICDKRFTHERFLKGHMKSAHQERNHRCHYCGKAFAELVCLKRHEKIHIKGKQFKCRFCQKEFHLKANRENHEMTHTGEKPLKCQFCNKGFIQKTNLKKHEESHMHGRFLQRGPMSKLTTRDFGSPASDTVVPDLVIEDTYASFKF